VIYRFEAFELDMDRYELRRDGQPRAVEPQVFALLALLVENRHRMLPREEIIGSIWAGRAVSDSALSSRIKSARQALDDDGNAQRLIRTVHGQGFRFVGDVESVAAPRPLRPRSSGPAKCSPGPCSPCCRSSSKAGGKRTPTSPKALRRS
jgi:DNA-binding winged helix-turn-helix (wHTH) protein